MLYVNGLVSQPFRARWEPSARSCALLGELSFAGVANRQHNHGLRFAAMGMAPRRLTYRTLGGGDGRQPRQQDARPGRGGARRGDRVAGRGGPAARGTDAQDRSADHRWTIAGGRDSWAIRVWQVMAAPA